MFLVSFFCHNIKAFQHGEAPLKRTPTPVAATLALVHSRLFSLSLPPSIFPSVLPSFITTFLPSMPLLYVSILLLGLYTHKYSTHMLEQTAEGQNGQKNVCACGVRACARVCVFACTCVCVCLYMTAGVCIRVLVLSVYICVYWCVLCSHTLVCHGQSLIRAGTVSWKTSSPGLSDRSGS